MRTTIVVASALLVVGACVTWFAWPRGPGNGDPGGRVVNQLTPAFTALPGYGTPALPWVSQLPPSLNASYLIKMEPHQDSCDGRPGTQGWSQVAVQSRFSWDRGLASLVDYLGPRLEAIGWVLRPQPVTAYPPTQSWTKTLNNGTRAFLGVTQEGPDLWQLDGLAEPVGRAASGC